VPAPTLGSASLNPTVKNETVLVVGDSLARALGNGMSAVTGSRQVTIVNAAIGGCGLLLPVKQRLNGAVTPTNPDCNKWPTAWAELVKQYHPDAVYLTTSFWDAADQVIRPGGAVGNLADPSFQERWVKNAARAITTLQADGAHVYLDDLNPTELHGVQKRAVDAANSPKVTLLPLYEQLCSGTNCPAQVNGIQVLDDTGHPAGESRDRLARWLLNEMTADLAQQ
jgi:hypothetical protein